MEEQKAKLYKYLKAERVDHDILHCTDKDTKKEMMISVNAKGELYDKRGAIAKSKIKRYWHALFFYALANAYEIVPTDYLHKEIT